MPNRQSFDVDLHPSQLPLQRPSPLAAARERLAHVQRRLERGDASVTGADLRAARAAVSQLQALEQQQRQLAQQAQDAAAELERRLPLEILQRVEQVASQMATAAEALNRARANWRRAALGPLEALSQAVASWNDVVATVAREVRTSAAVCQLEQAGVSADFGSLVTVAGATHRATTLRGEVDALVFDLRRGEHPRG